MKKYTEILNKNKYKLTKPRLAVLEILKKNHSPLSAQEIFNKCEKKFDLTSVYRSLELFKKLKFLQEEQNEGQTKYYLSPIPHHHITCEKCGKTECVPCKHQFNFKNFTNIKHQIILSGVCKNCG